MISVRKTDYKVLLKIPFVVANTVKEKDSIGSFISFQMLCCVVLNRSQIRAQHTGQILSRKGHLTFWFFELLQDCLKTILFLMSTVKQKFSSLKNCFLQLQTKKRTHRQCMEQYGVRATCGLLPCSWLCVPCSHRTYVCHTARVSHSTGLGPSWPSLIPQHWDLLPSISTPGGKKSWDKELHSNAVTHLGFESTNVFRADIQPGGVGSDPNWSF